MHLEGEWDHDLITEYFNPKDILVASKRSSHMSAISSDGTLTATSERADLTSSLPNAPNSAHAAKMAGTSQIVAKLFLIGRLELTDTNGSVYTPRGKKACALLALLALAPRRQRTKVWLRDKLWSESSERKSSNNLRQLIFELRRDLGGFFDAILDVDRDAISLKRGALWVDYCEVEANPSLLKTLRISPGTDLLEGLDVRDEEFEYWLLLERQNWQEKCDALFERASEAQETLPVQTGTVTPSNVIVPTPEIRISFGLLPNIQQGCNETTAHVSDYLLEGIVKNLRELHPIDVFDLRDTLGHSDGITGASNTDYFIRIRALQIRNSLTLTFFLYCASNMTLEWSQSIQTTEDEVLNWDSYVLSGFITQNVDRISRSIEKMPLREGTPNREPVMAGYTALNMMFRLDDMALDNAEQLLTQDSRGPGETLFSALRAYAASFKVGENLGSITSDAFVETDKLVREALDNNPFNSVSLACLGHAIGYVFREHNLAGDLLERALKLNQNQAFVWDHYALNKLYSGEYEAAHKAALRAVYLGSYSPISYSYDTTLAMTATMLGNHQQAIVASQNALKKQPKFTAAMRYLMVNLAKTGQEDEANDVYQRLLVRDPEFSDAEVQKARFRISQKSIQTDLINSIKRFTD